MKTIMFTLISGIMVTLAILSSNNQIGGAKKSQKKSKKGTKLKKAIVGITAAGIGITGMIAYQNRNKEDTQLQLQKNIKDRKVINSDKNLPEYLQKFRFRKVLSKQKWKKVNVIGDGSCLFHSVFHCINNKKIKNSKSLRSKTIKWIKNHQNDVINGITLKMVIELEFNEPIDEYLKRMQNSTEYGGQVEIIAMSRLLDQTILVYIESKNRYNLVEEYSQIINNNKQSIRLVYDGNGLYGGHYEFIIRK